MTVTETVKVTVMRTAVGTVMVTATVNETVDTSSLDTETTTARAEAAAARKTQQRKRVTHARYISASTSRHASPALERSACQKMTKTAACVRTYVRCTEHEPAWLVPGVDQGPGA